MARVVVCGFMIRYPLVGMQLAYFHYVAGLHRLGHEVFYLEESGWPSSCYDPAQGKYGDDPSSGIRSVRALMTDGGVDIPMSYVRRDSGETVGATRDEVTHMLRSADLLINLGGICWLPEFRLCRRLALVDMDPLFTQVGRFSLAELGEYHAHFSYGANIGSPDCLIPTNGIRWLPTVPPVVVDMWPFQRSTRSTEDGTGRAEGHVFTTVANWSAYGGITYDGEYYGQKDEEFRRLLDLPQRTAQRLELALSGVDEATVESLRAVGWSVRNAGDVSADMRTYRAFIAGSRGELSVAKHAYVKTHSGWFSDRSVCYLAAGLPVILQDTGFSDWLPVGRGVLAFTSNDEALDCIEQVNADYPLHRRAARTIAVQTFGHSAVLPRLLDAAIK